MGLKVFPEGDHMKAIFAPKGSGAPGGKFKAAGTLGITGIREFWMSGPYHFYDKLQSTACTAI